MSKVLGPESQSFDLVILGAGFSGALVAQIASRSGLRVGLLEKSSHPRFAIGESSTPLANLLIEEISEEFRLPELKKFSSYSQWTTHLPHITCGLKRGFSFFHHPSPGKPWSRSSEKEWLVAASPHNGLADTHWFREHLDQYWTQQAVDLGTQYLDRFTIDSLDEISEEQWLITGHQEGIENNFTTWKTPWIIDGTGPRGALSQLLQISEQSHANYPKTAAIYNHFTQVTSWSSLHPEYDLKNDSTLPYPVDDAAVHHIFSEGWMWILKFNNGITSAGLSLLPEVLESLVDSSGRLNVESWQCFLARYPSIQELFENSRTVQDWRSLNPMPYFASKMHGWHGNKLWTLLPSAAFFIDPLLSSGFPMTLIGIQRLGRILKVYDPERTDSLKSLNQGLLKKYEDQCQEEMNGARTLVGKMLSNLDSPALFQALTRFYFVAASYSETMRRLGRPEKAPGFLLAGHADYSSICSGLMESLPNNQSENQSIVKWMRRQLEALRPFDVMGMTNANRGSRFPAMAEDLMEASERIGISQNELSDFLSRSGFNKPF